jgi:hydroxyacylglutathione hydrolase
VDLLGVERMAEMARLLHESIFEKLYPLGDDVIVCPGHGAGSVCGVAIADRPWTTIGLERRLNPKLKYKDRGEFAIHAAKELERPPYFRTMEKLNVEGPPLLKTLPDPPPLHPEDFSAQVKSAQVVDTRMELGFGAAHVPGALSIWQGGLPAFAGWFLSYEKPVLLVTETNEPMSAVRPLIRMGYDDITGSLSGGMLSWHMEGLESSRIGTIPVQDLCRILDERRQAWILDVRSDEELEKEGRITDAHQIHITQVSLHLREIPRDEPVYIFCGSGLRSMIAASFLQREGWKDLTVVLGGLAGWRSVSCPVRQD